MNAPFPPNPSFGQYYGNWVWSGQRWVCTNTGIRVVVQTFRASAPYTPSPGLVSTTVEAWGGGGGGGFCLGDANSSGGGGGGGSGGYSRVTLAAALVLGGVNVTIGTGGGGGNIGGELNSQPGTPTTFGALCVASGGAGGQGNTSSLAWGQGGGGAAVGVGDLAIPGNPGFPGTSSGVVAGVVENSAGGTGGAILGGAGIALLTPPGASNAGANGLGPGAGGAGATVNQVTTPVELAGGTGGPGLCIATDYCWADAMDTGCGCGPTGGARVAINDEGWGRQSGRRPPQGFDDD